jgi:hypothetical protein
MYKLGQEIIINSKLVRVSFYKRSLSSFNRRRKEWVTLELKEPQKVIVVGVRTLFDGWVDWDEDCGNSFEQDNHIKALLVTSKLSQKPFYVKYE